MCDVNRKVMNSHDRALPSRTGAKRSAVLTSSLPGCHRRRLRFAAIETPSLRGPAMSYSMVPALVRRITVVFVAVLLSLLASGGAFAQSVAGRPTINGTVLDPEAKV